MSKPYFHALIVAAALAAPTYSFGAQLNHGAVSPLQTAAKASPAAPAPEPEWKNPSESPAAPAPEPEWKNPSASPAAPAPEPEWKNPVL